MLLPLGVAYPAAFSRLALLATQGAPVAALVVCSTLAGATLPPLGACMRALWPSLLATQGLRDTAYALEAWLQELFFVFGPLITAAIAVLASPWAAVLAAAAFAGIGTLWFALTPSVRAARAIPAAALAGGCARLGRRAHGHAVDVRDGIAFGVVEVAMPAFGEEHGSRAQGGFALSCFALGSLARRPLGRHAPARRARLAMRFTLALGALALALVPPLVAPSIARDVRAHADRRPAHRARFRVLLRAGRRACHARNDDGGIRAARHRDRRGPLARNVGERPRDRAVRPHRRACAGRTRVGAAALLALARRESLAVPDAAA